MGENKTMTKFLKTQKRKKKWMEIEKVIKTKMEIYSNSKALFN